MNILGIETSCDETSASVVKNGRDILSNVVVSSLRDHKKYGGIIPEIASRRQMELINTVIQASLEKAKLKLNNVQAIAVTQSPGLIGSLLVGLSYARALSFAARKPLVEVDHIKAHLYASFLKTPQSPPLKKGDLGGFSNTDSSKSPLAPLWKRGESTLPAIGLVVSGGHSSLYYIKDFAHYQLLGQTRDDAAGEAFDKVARILGLGYPGGPVIDRLARKNGRGKEKIHFPCAELGGSFDFSFSGTKTAVLYYKHKYQTQKNFNVNRVAYAFQDSVVSILVKKSIGACRKRKVRTLVVGGGVAANSSLRERLNKEAQESRINVFFPPVPLCMDNAAMVAGLGYHLLQKNFVRNNK